MDSLAGVRPDSCTVSSLKFDNTCTKIKLWRSGTPPAPLGVPMRMRTITGWILAAALVWVPATAGAQTLGDVLEAMRVGGGWIRIPVDGGRGTLLTPSLPSAGRSIEGCMEIWPGHSGSWTLKVNDTYGNGRLETLARPADDIPFTYQTGLLAQLEVDVRWSEPRDTTLLVWVGLRSARGERDPCEPVYQSSDSRRSGGPTKD